MKLSIITVSLNSETTIEQTIQSVISQKDESVEYIVIDGNSTDRTLEIVNKYKVGVDIIISEPDQGIYDAMNKGISLSTGEIIGIINSDDWYEEGTIKKVREYFEDSGADVVYGNINLIGENGNIELKVPSDINKIRYEMIIPHPTTFVKKDIYEKYGCFSLEYKIAADYELMLRYYINGVKFAYLNEILANFRMGGISYQQSKICAHETFYISKKFLEYCPLEEREYLKKTIKTKENSVYFRQLLDEFPDCLLKYITKIVDQKLKCNISIFGAGRWGRDMYNLLLNKGISPLFLVDNNSKFWGKSEGNMKISSPDYLKSFDGILLILVKEFSTEILSQVKEMNNTMIACVTWEELVDVLKDNVFSG